MSGAAARPRGRPARFPDRRHEVLRTAARIFSREGFRQATLADIAQALDMTRPALYYYAESKDELLAQCGEISREQLEAALAEAQREASGLARLRAWFVNYAVITCDDFGRCFVLTDHSEMHPAEGERNRLAQLRLGRAAAAMVRQGIEDGSIRPCDPVIASRALYAIFNGMARWHRPDNAKSPAQFAGEFLDLVVQGLGRTSVPSPS